MTFFKIVRTKKYRPKCPKHHNFIKFKKKLQMKRKRKK